MTHGKNCNLYRLQDVFYYLDRSGVHYANDRGAKRLSLSQERGKARKALHDACVKIPRSVSTHEQLMALAKKVGDAHGFDARSGVYRKR